MFTELSQLEKELEDGAKACDTLAKKKEERDSVFYFALFFVSFTVYFFMFSR